ncbi:helix-turn-helix domain-containing protein [Lacrimispora sp.]|uniref:helix-turn-helix domain-containing protein n=1 Tax=Lacrimispora sp. TaxID=2719234 RepID=UPI0034604747
MLQYIRDSKEIIEDLKKAGYTTTLIRKEKLLSESTLQNLRKGTMIDSNTLGKVCDMLKCQPEDLVVNVTSEEDQKKYINILKDVR